MDFFLNSVTRHAMSYAIRSGITITGGYAMRECSRLLKAAPTGSDKEELLTLQMRLQSKIRIISPAIDMIELIAARGNTSLESAVTLTKELRWEIQALGVRLAKAANEEELVRRRSARAKSREQTDLELKMIVTAVKMLLTRIEDAVPLINLAITTSGVSLSTNLPATVSPSRLLQASTFLTAADSLYASSPTRTVQVGPAYTLSVYMLFAGHAWRPQDDEDIRETTWKEVIHKARVKLMRVPLDGLYDLEEAAASSKKNRNGSSQIPDSIPGEALSSEFAYQIVLIEDLDDDRVHTFDESEPQPGPFQGVAHAGIRDLLPIHEISKIFYADTGKILNIGTDGETNSPVLLFKRDIYAEPPRRMMERQESQGADEEDEGHENGHAEESVVGDEQNQLDAQLGRESSPAPIPHLPPQDTTSSAWRLPPDLDPEWIAFEVYTEESDTDDESELVSETEPSSRPSTSRQGSLDPAVTSALSNLTLQPSTPVPSPTPTHAHAPAPPLALAVPIKTSLSLLEMLIRLTALQQFRQSSHLSIEDELLNFFLEDSSTTGAGPNAEYRQRVRRDARRRVGFDPYDESPIKRRGEEYLAHPRASPRSVEQQGWEQRGGGYEDVEDDWDGGRRTPDVRPSIETGSEGGTTGRRDASSSSPSPSLRARPRPAASARTSPNPAMARYGTPPAATSSPGPPIARSRAGVLRSRWEKTGRSPLSRSVSVGVPRADSTLGTSPSSEGVEDVKIVEGAETDGT